MAASAAGAAASIIGGQIGKANAAGAAGNANNAANVSNQILQSIQQAPDISKPLILQQYKQAGLLTPEMEQNITAQIPAAIGSDATALNAQKGALQQMQQRAAGGLSAGDRAALTQSGLQAQGDVTGRLGAIQQKMQEQGLSDSGSKLAMQLQAAQGGANTEAAGANQIAQQAQQAAIQATGQAAGLGSQLEQQQFGQGMANQQAANQMQRFNIQNQLGVQQQNTANSNNMQAANLANAQGVSNANVSGANQEQANQLQREMQQYGANTNTAQIQAGGMSNYGQQQQGLANNQAQSGVNMGTGLGGMISGALSGPSASDKNQTAQANYYNSMANSGGYAGSDPMAGATPKAWTGGQIGNYKNGGHVPGQATMDGDHPQNDTVHAMLSPGEIVIPRTVAKSSLGKKLLKLLSDHHDVQNELDKHGQG
jgi:hypothetical protein